MVAFIVQLKWQLLHNSLKRSVAQLVGLIIGGLYGLAVLVGALVGLIALRFGLPSDVARTAVVVVVQLVAGAAVFVLTIPLYAVGTWALTGPVRAAWLCLGIGIVLGSTVPVGLRWGIRIFERRTPELLADLTRIR